MSDLSLIQFTLSAGPNGTVFIPFDCDVIAGAKIHPRSCVVKYWPTMTGRQYRAGDRIVFSAGMLVVQARR